MRVRISLGYDGGEKTADLEFTHEELLGDQDFINDCLAKSWRAIRGHYLWHTLGYQKSTEILIRENSGRESRN